jgi:hypothetical protein
MNQVHELRATIEAAEDFGLDVEEIWAAVREVCDRTPAERPAGRCLNEVAGTLAARIAGRL